MTHHPPRATSHTANDRRARAIVWALVAYAASGTWAIAACSAGSNDRDGTGGSGASAVGGTGGGLTGFGGQGGGPSAVAHLQGSVRAPEGTIPISGALLYLTATYPEPIPDGVYCDRCVELDPGTPYTTSNADGSFELPAYATGYQYLVVQKGQFRRVRPVTVSEGNQAIDVAMTTLPGAMDKAGGDDIPRMAILVGAWDDIGDTLGKLGMQPGSFDRFEYPFPPDANYPFNPDKLTHDAARMNQYHIVFTPCDSSNGTECGYSSAEDNAVQQNLQQFVAAGGKLYVTDYSYDYIAQSWPEYIDWVDQTASFGSACLPGSYDAPATVDDQGMSDWLAAQGITSFTLQANWTAIAQVNTVATTDWDNQPIAVTPKVWVRGQTPSYGLSPTTVSFERSCGRVLFSTYHTEGTGGASLLAQEKALLYVLLEVGVCIGPPIVR